MIWGYLHFRKPPNFIDRKLDNKPDTKLSVCNIQHQQSGSQAPQKKHVRTVVISEHVYRRGHWRIKSLKWLYIPRNTSPSKMLAAYPTGEAP